MKKLSNLLDIIGGVFVMLAVLVVFGNVVVRVLTGGSFNGSYELTGLCATMFVALAIPVATFEGSHIFVELLTSHLHGVTKRVTEYIDRVFDLLFEVLYFWAGWKIALQKFATMEATDTLHIPVWPFRFLWVLCCALMIVFTIYNIFQIHKHTDDGGTSLDAEIAESLEAAEAPNEGKEDETI